MPQSLFNSNLGGQLTFVRSALFSDVAHKRLASVRANGSRGVMKLFPSEELAWVFRYDVASGSANCGLVAQLPMCPTSGVDSHMAVTVAASVGCVSDGAVQDLTWTGRRYHAL